MPEGGHPSFIFVDGVALLLRGMSTFGAGLGVIVANQPLTLNSLFQLSKSME
jgi:hypothetical protein